MLEETRIIQLEREFRKLKAMFAALCLGMLSVISIAAASVLKDEVIHGKLSILDGDDNEKIALKPNGDVEVSGNLVVKGVRIGAVVNAPVGAPVGTVVAFAGDWPPYKDRVKQQLWTEEELGWKLCDGRLLEIKQYPLLSEAIGTDNGNTGTKGTHFNLPDYRGRFLRGVSGDREFAKRDPDRDKRLAMNPGGNAGNAVGSIQEDEFKSHTHYMGHRITFNPPKNEPKGPKHEHTTNPGYMEEHRTDAQGGSETRPKNVYVHWIIKIK